ncbi:hypothetical protein BH23GEM9_BH23GEM9_32100 [soil metagenome]
MTENRRYREDEVREIFGLAAQPGNASPPVSVPKGLTLADIQEIGLEVGLEPAVIARAAASLDARGTKLPRRTSLGMPIEVGRIVPLPRALTDLEWERLVAELRSTFGARGKVTSLGGLREWANGNLHACIEPTEAGYRLRLGTVKGDAITLNILGATGLATGAITFGAILAGGGLQEAFFVPVMFGASGVAAFLSNLLRLPRWTQQREQQMEHIASRIGSIMDASPDMDPPPEEGG